MSITHTIGIVDLNDRASTYFDRLDIPGTRLFQFEPLAQRDGEVAVVRTDRVPLVMTAYLVFVETSSNFMADWIRYLEDQTIAGVPLILGDGRKYEQCYAHDIVATHGGFVSLSPPLRWMRVSFKITSRHNLRVMV